MLIAIFTIGAFLVDPAAADRFGNPRPAARELVAPHFVTHPTREPSPIARPILLAENLQPSAAKSLEFKEEPKPKTGRGPASVKAPEQPTYTEIADEETEAGFCLFCGTTGGARARTLVEQSDAILKQAEKSASGK